MAAFNIQLEGFPAANREAKVTLRNQATGQKIERNPFLDGSLLVRDVDPGMWEVTVTHPNLVVPVDTRVVRLFPQVPPTLVPIRVPPDLFSDRPIRDVPDVDLGPVQQAAGSVKTRLAPVGGKAPGQTVQSSDWNALVDSVTDLASATLQLTTLVSPRGHDHPEIAEKIAEVQENIRRFAESFGRSLVELRREIEAEFLRRHVTDVLDLGGAAEDVRSRFSERLASLEASLQADTTVFTQKLSSIGTLVLNEVNVMAVSQGAAGDAFLANPSVQQLSASARDYAEAGVLSRPESELQTYQRTSAAAGGLKLTNIVRR